MLRFTFATFGHCIYVKITSNKRNLASWPAVLLLVQTKIKRTVDYKNEI